MDALGMILFISVIVTMCLMILLICVMDSTTISKPEITTTNIPPVTIDKL